MVRVRVRVRVRVHRMHLVHGVVPLLLAGQQLGGGRGCWSWLGFGKVRGRVWVGLACRVRVRVGSRG